MKEDIKRLYKAFIFIFLISFLIINWNDISWIFNYRVISQTISDFFQKDSPDSPIESEIPEIIEFEYSEKENSLEIPKIEVSAPLIFVENSDEEKVYESLDKGLVHFPSSVLPGGKGQTIILGHSAPPNWPDIKYDNVFSRLNELEEGDEIFVYFEHQKYNYSVTNKFFLERGEEVPEYLTNSDNMLVLISCWPPGKDIRRIAVEAKLKIE
jgi:LPXTG-site transpeptidase (sortase) family protein